MHPKLPTEDYLKRRLNQEWAETTSTPHLCNSFHDLDGVEPVSHPARGENPFMNGPTAIKIQLQWKSPQNPHKKHS